MEDVLQSSRPYVLNTVLPVFSQTKIETLDVLRVFCIKYTHHRLSESGARVRHVRRYASNSAQLSSVGRIHTGQNVYVYMSIDDHSYNLYVNLKKVSGECVLNSYVSFQVGTPFGSQTLFCRDVSSGSLGLGLGLGLGRTP